MKRLALIIMLLLACSYAQAQTTVVVGRASTVKFTFRAVASSEASATCGKPTGTASGDFLVATMFLVDDAAVTPPTGWTEVFTDTSGGGAEYKVFTKTAGGSEPADYTWTDYAAAYSQIVIAAYSMVGSGSFDVSAAIVDSVENSATIVANTVTTTESNDLVIYFGSKNFLDVTWTASGGTERYDGMSSFYYDEIKTTAGTTTARTFTSSWSNTDARNVLTVAFK